MPPPSESSKKWPQTIRSGGNGGTHDDMESEVMAIDVGDDDYEDDLLTKANLQTLGSDIMSLATKDIQSWVQSLDRGVYSENFV